MTRPVYAVGGAVTFIAAILAGHSIGARLTTLALTVAAATIAVIAQELAEAEVEL